VGTSACTCATSLDGTNCKPTRAGADCASKHERRDKRSKGQSAAGLTHHLLAFSRRQPLDPKRIDRNIIEAVLAGGLWQAFRDWNPLENALINPAVKALQEQMMIRAQLLAMRGLTDRS